MKKSVFDHEIHKSSDLTEDQIQILTYKLSPQWF